MNAPQNPVFTAPHLVTQAEFARICGVNRSTVTRWLQNGRIQATAQGFIDPQAAQRMREATESPAAHHQARKAQFDDQRGAFAGQAQGLPLGEAQNAPTGPENRPATPNAADATPTATAYAPARGPADTMPAAEKIGTALKLETYKLQKAKAERENMELDKMAGSLVERAEVDYALADFGNTLRALLESLPDRLASQLATLHGDVSAMHQALEEAMHDALAQMAENMKRKTKELAP